MGLYLENQIKSTVIKNIIYKKKYRFIYCIMAFLLVQC